MVVGRALLDHDRTGILVGRLLTEGTPDPSFGTGGITITDPGDRDGEGVNVRLADDGSIVVSGGSSSGGSGTSVARYLADEGRIILAGVTSAVNPNFVVVRLLTDGTLDTSFSSTGAIAVDFAGSSDVAENMAVTAAGDIVVGGESRHFVGGYGVARLTPASSAAGGVGWGRLHKVPP